MIRVFLTALGVTVVLSASPVRAQRTDFADLRPDGNGIAELRATIGIGFDGITAASALTLLAERARLNLTFELRVPGLDTKLFIAPHERTVAAALLEVARDSRTMIRVSARGQIVVLEARGTVAARAASPSDTTSRSAVALPAVRTEAERIERRTFATSSTVGAVSITGRELRSSPSFVEPDVMRSVQLLPGIEARSDWAAGFNVRGGESDQSLVMIDGYPIYNPFHLGGLFSTFIGPTVGRVELRKGAFPARFGGRLSGVLDVQLAEPTSRDMSGTVEVSLASSLATLGRTFADGNGSWTVAARRTYADAVVNRFKPDAFPYHFQDFQGRVARRFANDWRVSLTAYTGRDVASATEGDPAKAEWGNSVVGAMLGKSFGAPRVFGIPLGDSLGVEQRFSTTRFSAHIDVPNTLFHAQNRVTELRLAGSMSAYGRRSTTTLGYDLVAQRLGFDATAAFPDLGDFIPLDSLHQRATIASGYVNQLWRAGSRLLVEGGLRVDAVNPLGWSGVSPRMSLKYFLGTNTALTAGVGTYAQWMHSLGREEEPVKPLQFWVGSDSVTPVSRARDAVLGVERWLSPLRLLHVEAFVKRYENLLVPNPENAPYEHGDEFDRTRGTSYGVDFLLRQLDGGRFSGWIAYTYAMNSRTSSDGTRYFPTQDRRHNLNLVGSWRSGAYTLGARANLASGLPTTPVLGAFTRGTYNPVAHRWMRGETGFSSEEAIAGARNSARLPKYSRIDLSVNRTGRLFGATVSPYLSIVNVLNAHNPAAYLYSFGSAGERASFPNLPFVPTFGVSLVY